MTAPRNIVRLVPFFRSADGTFDLPADAPPIAGISLGSVPNVVSQIPVVVWVPYVESTYDDDEIPTAEGP